MVRVASELYRQSIRGASVQGWGPACGSRPDRSAVMFRPSGRAWNGRCAICPLARPPGLRSSPRRSRVPIRVTGGEYGPDTSASHPAFHCATRGHANHGSCGSDARGFRKSIGLTVPVSAAAMVCMNRSSPWSVPRCRDGGPVRQSLETIHFRSRLRITACDGLGRAFRACRWGVAEIP